MPTTVSTTTTDMVIATHVGNDSAPPAAVGCRTNQSVQTKARKSALRIQSHMPWAVWLRGGERPNCARLRRSVRLGGPGPRSAEIVHVHGHVHVHVGIATVGR